ncbi:LysE family translocator [Aliirhizobium smilacinae]|uniref:Permease n=1 Tax=Aliirhizobium smilacinae TaxID=1395944 RepID=A0A5C4XJK9_9HYPH|nr:LysE family transporter [Rhizobium smilacinae]TNM63537.1 permease [Rhizobium smilacinae]
MSEMACLLAGAGAGLSIAIPFGPTSMMCVERTLADGMRAGMAAGLGVATVHLSYSTIALVGGMTLMSQPETANLLTFAAGLLLLYFAARLWRRDVVFVQGGSALSFRRAYCGAICLGFLNPVTPALCAASLTAFASQIAAPGGLLPLGVFAGSLTWWLVLAVGVSLLRQRLNIETLTLANRGAGILLVLLGISMLAKSFEGLIHLAS